MESREVTIMANGKTICTVCNYIFDEELGEPRQQIAAGVRFEELADEWSCPECGSGKDMFQPCSCVSLSIYEHTCINKNGDTGSASEQPKDGLAAQSVGQIVTENPNLACVFEQYGIDYCCGGKKTLQDACLEKGVSINLLLERLKHVQVEGRSRYEPDWTSTSLRTLVEHLVSRYHEPLRTELPRISELAAKVARVHGARHPEMVRVAEVFETFREQLEQHMQKEELILFPGIAAMEAGKARSFGCGGSVDHPIEMMTREHDDAGDALAELSRLTHQYTPPEDACTTFKILLHSLATLELEMHQHVHKENNILFPRAIDMSQAAACR